MKYALFWYTISFVVLVVIIDLSLPQIANRIGGWTVSEDWTVGPEWTIGTGTQNTTMDSFIGSVWFVFLIMVIVVASVFLSMSMSKSIKDIETTRASTPRKKQSSELAKNLHAFGAPGAEVL